MVKLEQTTLTTKTHKTFACHSNSMKKPTTDQPSHPATDTTNIQEPHSKQHLAKLYRGELQNNWQAFAPNQMMMKYFRTNKIDLETESFYKISLIKNKKYQITNNIICSSNKVK